MYFDSDRDGVGLDLTPFVTAVNTGTEAYGKIAAAEAAKKAAIAGAKAAARQPAPTPQRRVNPLAYALLGLALVGGFLVVRRIMKPRRR